MPDSHAPDVVVVGIDPGQQKCGIAAVSREGAALHRCICTTETLLLRVKEVCEAYGAAHIVIGDGTNGRKLAQVLHDHPGFPPVQLVCERNSTLNARELYFADHPPKGLKKLLPRGLLAPPEPIDDYAAALLARQFISGL